MRAYGRAAAVRSSVPNAASLLYVQDISGGTVFINTTWQLVLLGKLVGFLIYLSRARANGIYAGLGPTHRSLGPLLRAFIMKCDTICGYFLTNNTH
jgi:hypothetical protein